MYSVLEFYNFCIILLLGQYPLVKQQNDTDVIRLKYIIHEKKETLYNVSLCSY